MTTQTNENMTKYTILPSDNWQKIASAGDVVNIQNISTGANAIIQVVDSVPSDDVDWGYVLYPKADFPFTATHDVYARGLRATIQIVVQKD